MEDYYNMISDKEQMIYCYFMLNEKTMKYEICHINTLYDENYMGYLSNGYVILSKYLIEKSSFANKEFLMKELYEYELYNDWDVFVNNVIFELNKNEYLRNELIKINDYDLSIYVSNYVVPFFENSLLSYDAPNKSTIDRLNNAAKHIKRSIKIELIKNLL
jgi:hypothetical protein